jgi:beta-glucosidase
MEDDCGRMTRPSEGPFRGARNPVGYFGGSRLKTFGKATLGVFLVLLVAWLAACAWFSRELAPDFTTAELAEFAPSWPKGFLWGTATAAHQVEGGQHNDWTRFEEQPGAITNGEKSGRADDMWNRFPQDVLLMKALHANAFRLSVEWSRVEPVEGQWDEAAWTHYAEWMHLLSRNGITPMVTLLHYTLPQWMADRGGLTARDFPERFARFAREAATRFGPDVHVWCTINEPNYHLHHAYIAGNYPPQQRSAVEAVKAFAGLLRAHALAAHVIREHDSAAKIGVAISLTDYEPSSRWSLPDWLVAKKHAGEDNWAFYDSIMRGRISLKLASAAASNTVASNSYLNAADRPADRRAASIDEPLPGLLGSVDWFGANYYDRNLVGFAPFSPGSLRLREGPGPTGDLGWEIYPEGLLTTLHAAWRRYKLPVYITENGIPDAAGTKRAAFIRGHAYAVSRAIAEGVPVQGYFFWSFVDNFEWVDGFAPRFGLYRVDYATLDRQLAPGAEEFIKLAPR